MGMRKIVKKRLTIGLSEFEMKCLDYYCQIHERRYSDVIRDCLRQLIISEVKNDLKEANID